MLSVNTIARVIVNAVRSSASPASFDTGLILIKDTNYADSRRLAAVDDSAAAIAGHTLNLGLLVPFLAAVGTGVVVYFVMIVALRAITLEDMKLIPKGEKIAKLLHIR